MAQDAAQWHTLKQAADMLGKSKSVLEYHAGKLGAEDRRTDENGVILISEQALDRIRTKLRKTAQQAPKKHTTSTQQAHEPTTQQAPNNDNSSTQQVHEMPVVEMLRQMVTEQNLQLDELRNQVDGLREKLHEADKAAAVAAAERDAAIQRADDLNAVLKNTQQQFTAEQVLHAQTIQNQKRLGDSSGGQIGADGEPDDSNQKRRGILARLFRK